MHFALRIDIEDYGHNSATAQAAKVRELLAVAMRQLGSSPARSSELTMPQWDVNRGSHHQATVGSWEFTEDETRNPAGER